LTPEEVKVANSLDILEGPWKDIFAKPAEPVSVTEKPAEPEIKPQPNESAPDKSGSGKEIPPNPIIQLKNFLNQILEDPDNPEPRLKYINLYLEDGLEYDLVDDYLALANCYRNNGQLEEAKQYFQKVLELDPSVMEAQHKLSILEGKPLETSTATEMVSPIIETHLNAQVSPEPVSIQATDLTADEQKTIMQLRRLLLINPINEIIAKKLANLYRSKGMITESVQEMTLVADVYMQRGLFKKANQIYEQLVKDSPSDDLRVKLGKSRTYLSSQGAIDDAIKSYKTGIKSE
jgi:tetratricopeptide (TPR) repeat protein